MSPLHKRRLYWCPSTETSLCLLLRYPKGWLASSPGFPEMVARFPLPLDREMDWDEMVYINGHKWGEGMAKGGKHWSPFLLFSSWKASAVCLAYLSDPEFIQFLEKQELESLFSLPFLFIVLTAVSCTHPQKECLLGTVTWARNIL